MTPRVKARIKHYKMLGRVKAKTRPDNAKGKVGCLLWSGNIRSDEWGFYQYGVAVRDGRRTTVHRILWEEKYGPLNGRTLVNQCGNTLCVAPDHWTAVHHWTEIRRAKKEASAEASRLSLGLREDSALVPAPEQDPVSVRVAEVQADAACCEPHLPWL